MKDMTMTTTTTTNRFAVPGEVLPVQNFPNPYGHLQTTLDPLAPGRYFVLHRGRRADWFRTLEQAARAGYRL